MSIRREDPSIVYAFVIAVQWLIVINLLYMFFPVQRKYLILLYKSLRVIICTSDCLGYVISSKIKSIQSTGKSRGLVLAATYWISILVDNYSLNRLLKARKLFNNFNWFWWPIKVMINTPAQLIAAGRVQHSLLRCIGASLRPWQLLTLRSTVCARVEYSNVQSRMRLRLSILNLIQFCFESLDINCFHFVKHIKGYLFFLKHTFMWLWQ